MNRTGTLEAAARRAVVQPGVVVDTLNKRLRQEKLWFPVDVSTASRATIGGMTANNSCGGRSIRYGTMRANVVAIDGVLADGSQMHFGEVAPDLSDVGAWMRPLAANLLASGVRGAG